MSFEEIIADLKSRGEYSIEFYESGVTVSYHGRNTVNYWIVKEGKLFCYNCRTTNRF